MKNKYTLFILLFLAVKSFSQPGSLDVSFATKGKLLTTTPTNYLSPVHSVVCKRDGSLLVGSGELQSFFLKQFLSDGSPDSSFGEKGVVRTTFEAYAYYVYISALGSVGENKIVAAGVGQGGAGSHNADILLARYFENGTIDSSFGNNGMVASDFGLIEVISSMKITAEGKILVAGYCQADDESKATFFLAQYNSDGTVDTNFGKGGKVVTDIGASYISQINSIAIASDGSIIVTGVAEYIPDFLETKLIVARYTSRGKPDNKFGKGGFVLTDVGDNAEYGYAVALQDDGKIVVAGASNIGFITKAATLVVRYNADGSIDTSFNTTGSRSLTAAHDSSSAAYAIIIQQNGSILLGGEVCASKTCDFRLASVTKDGSIDSSFGTNGLVTTDFNGLTDQCYTLALQPDGKIIAAGGSSDNTFGYITLARYNNNESRRQIVVTRIRRWLQHHGITWQGDDDVRYYTVQRSVDGGITYQPVAKVYNHQPFYNYEDAAVTGGDNDSYRVATTGKDGRKTYSNIVFMDEAAVKVFPNPVRGAMQVQGLPANRKTNISILDFTGTVRTAATASGSNCSLNTSALKPGNYVLKVEHDNRVSTQTFVKE